MNANEHFSRMFRYDHWANRECLAALRAPGSEPPKALRLLAHTLSAQKLWLERLQQIPQSVAVWPASTVEECLTLAEEMQASWKKYVDHLRPPDFDKKIEYRNTRGELWSSRVEDVLIHVLMHSMYHRGQVALEMRAANQTPAGTDFIHGIRQGFVD